MGNSFFNFIHKSSICAFQFRYSSRINPRYVTCFSLLIVILLYVTESGKLLILHLDDLKITNEVLLALRVSLLSWNQLVINLSTFLASSFKVHLSPYI